jgi:hypothetical protein
VEVRLLSAALKYLLSASLSGHETVRPASDKFRRAPNYLMCDDVRATVEELGGKGVEFTRDISDEGFGLMTALRLPGGGELALYEPRRPSPLSPNG